MSHGDPVWLCYSVPWHPIVYYISPTPKMQTFKYTIPDTCSKDWTTGTAVCSLCSSSCFLSGFVILIILGIIGAFKQDASVWFSISLCLLKPGSITNHINIRLRKIWPFMWVIERLQYSVFPFEDNWPTKHNLGARSTESACRLCQSSISKSCRSSSSGSCPVLSPCFC